MYAPPKPSSIFFASYFLVADLGFGAAAVQAQSIDREQLRRMFAIVLVTSVLGMLAMVLGAPYAAGFFGEPRVVPVMRVLAIDFLLTALYVLPQSQLVRELDFKRKSKVDLAGMLAGALAAMAAALSGWGVWALVTGVLSASATKAVAYNVVRPIPMLPVFSLQTVRSMVRFGMLVTAGRILFFLYGNVDKAIGGKVLGNEALGLYAVALTLAAIPMEKVLPAITHVSFAAFSRIKTDAERVRRNLLRGTKLVSLACFPAFFGMAMVAPELLPLLLGPRWADLVFPFQVLALSLPLKAIAALFAPALWGVGRPGVNAGNMAIALGVMSVALLVGVQYGLIGMCFAWLIAYPFVFAAIATRSLRTLGIPLGAFLEQLVFPAAASVTMAGALLGLRYAMGPVELPLLRAALFIAAGAFHMAKVSDLVVAVTRQIAEIQGPLNFAGRPALANAKSRMEGPVSSATAFSSPVAPSG